MCCIYNNCKNLYPSFAKSKPQLCFILKAFSSSYINCCYFLVIYNEIKNIITQDFSMLINNYNVVRKKQALIKVFHRLTQNRMVWK